MTPATFTTALVHATAVASRGEAESRATSAAPSAAAVAREGFLLLGVLTAWGERVANGTMSLDTYAAKAVALTNRTEISHA